jgi:hypothetical protein
MIIIYLYNKNQYMFNKPKNVLKTGDFIGNPLIFPPDKA